MKVKCFYAHGTAWAFHWVEIGLRVDQSFGNVYVGAQQPSSKTASTVLGLNGRSAQWDLAPHNDPFAALLDPDKFEAVRIPYPAAMFPMNASINAGVQTVIDGINALPAGQPFVLGGYSQGAAVMSTVYNEIRYGSLTSRASMFLGGVMFGNPRRQINHRGAVGGSWSGLWYDELATTGGRGSFPATGDYALLTNCDDEWVEFAYPGDVFTCNGTATVGQNWSAANGVATSLDVGDIITYVTTGAAPGIVDAINQAFTKGGEVLTTTDGSGAEVNVTGSGHVAYPFLPPYGVATTDSCYQVALRFLDGLADDWATAPVLRPPSDAGWSTTLLPPAV